MMVVPDIELAYLSDEDYLLYRAKERQSSAASKAWLITAQVLYPNNFGVQFEVYMIEKTSKNVKEAARCLGTLIQEFPQEPALFTEIDDIMTAVQASSSLFDEMDDDPISPTVVTPAPTVVSAATANENDEFLSQLFYALPSNIQRGLVLTAAERCTDTMSHCSLLLLLTTHFPETTPLQAPNLVETLLSAEKRSSTPLNRYRKKLVCYVLPVLVSGEAGSLPVPPGLFLHLLNLALEYYIALLYSAKSSSDGDNSSQRVWRSVFSCVQQLGAKLGWTLAQYFTPDANREMVLQRVQTAVKTRQPDSEEFRTELLFVTVTLFLHSLQDYTRNIAKDNTGGSQVGVTLVEAFTTSATGTSGATVGGGSSRSSSVCSDDALQADVLMLSPPRPSSNATSKRLHRTSSQDCDAVVPCVTVGQGEGVCGAGLAQALSTAIKCWDILHLHPKLRTEVTGLLERLQLGNSLRLFTIDMLLHHARLADAGRDLRTMLTQVRREGGATLPSPSANGSGALTEAPTNQQQASTYPFTHLEMCLKLASVNYTLNNLSGAAEAALDAVHLLPAPCSVVPPPPSPAPSLPPHTAHNTTTPAPLTIAAGVERHLHLLPLSRGHCLQFIVLLLINALRSRVLLHKCYDDLSIGHLLTLVQFEWPKHESIFLEILSVLVKQGGLNYEQFSLYVTQPEMIEELVFLHTRDGGGLHLDIVPPPPHLTKQQRTVSTRGADRGSKHDFKLAMRKQMLRCDESVAHNIVTFLNNEGQSIHQNLI